MKDFIGAVNAGYTNEEINQANGTTGKDYIGAVKAGYTNEDLNSAIGSINTDVSTTPVDNGTIQGTVNSEGIKSYSEDIFKSNKPLDIFKNTYDAEVNAIDKNHSAKLDMIDSMGLDQNQTDLLKANLNAKAAKLKEDATIGYMKKINEKNLFELAGVNYNPTPVTTKQETEQKANVSEKPLETPAVSPEFALGGVLTKFGVVNSVAADIAASVATEGLDKTMKTLTPEFIDNHPAIYAGMQIATALGAGKVGAMGVTKSAEEVNAFTSDLTRMPKNIFLGKASDKQSYDFLVNKTGETPESINNAIDKFAKATNRSPEQLSYQDRINAILTNTSAGKEFKTQAQIYNDQTLGSLNKMEESISNAIKNSTKDGSFEIPAQQLRNYIDNSGSMYNEAKNALLDNYNTMVKINPEDAKKLEDTLAQSTTGVTKDTVDRIIGYLKNPEGISVENLLAAKQDLNSLNLKSTKAFKAGEVGDYIDSLVKNGVGEDAYSVWKEVNKRYATQALLKEDNPIGKLLLQSSTGEKGKVSSLSSDDIAKSLLNMKERGYDTFNFVKQALGEDATAMIEKKIVNLAFSDKNTNMSNAVDKIMGYEFSTTEGRNLQSEIDRLSGLISDKDVKSFMSGLLGRKVNTVGWSDNLLAKVKYGIVGQVWDAISKRLPSGEQERALTTIGDAIKNNKYENDITIKKGDAFQKAYEEEQLAMKNRIDELIAKGNARTAQENKELLEKKQGIKTIEDSISTMQKQIEYKPRDTSNEIIVGTRGTAVKGANPEDVAKAEEMQRAIEARKRGGSTYNPKGEFNDIQAPTKQVIDTEIIDEVNKQLPNLNIKTPTKDIIDAEVINYGNAPKQLSEEQSTRWNDIVKNEIAPIKANLESLNYAFKNIGKQNTSAKKKGEMARELSYQINKLNNDLKTAEKKLPKI